MICVFLQSTQGASVRVGGYVPPTDTRDLPEEVVFQAKRMLFPGAHESLAVFLRVSEHLHP